MRQQAALSRREGALDFKAAISNSSNSNDHDEKNKYYSSNRNKSNDKHNNSSNGNIIVVSMLAPGAGIMDVADGVFILANGVLNHTDKLPKIK